MTQPSCRCVSHARYSVMQFFGARAISQRPLYAINGGRDEMSGKQAFAEGHEPISGDGLPTRSGQSTKRWIGLSAPTSRP